MPAARLKINAKTCCPECARALLPKITSLRAELELAPAKVGTMNELLVAAELIRRGYSVYKSVCKCDSCDFIIKDRADRLLRLEVTTGTVDASGALAHFPKSFAHAEVIAVVTEGGIIFKTSKIEIEI